MAFHTLRRFPFRLSAPWLSMSHRSTHLMKASRFYVAVAALASRGQGLAVHDVVPAAPESLERRGLTSWGGISLWVPKGGTCPSGTSSCINPWFSGCCPAGTSCITAAHVQSQMGPICCPTSEFPPLLALIRTDLQTMYLHETIASRHRLFHRCRCRACVC